MIVETIIPTLPMVPEYRLKAAQSVLAVREAELLTLKGPCRIDRCRLHFAHSGPCDIE